MHKRPSGWHPPHCPNPNCKFHGQESPHWRFKRKGYYTRRIPPHRIQRFTCLHCHRTFSTQTFSTTYWLKRADLLEPIFMSSVGCMANRQIARALRVSASTVDRQISRLARHCMLFHAQIMTRSQASDLIAIDGFESFELSQYFPFHHNLAVEIDTGFFLYHTDSPMRRKGCMTTHQKNRRMELESQFGRPDPQSIRKGMTELLEVVSGGKHSLTILSDEHKSYPPAIRRLRCSIKHNVTSSRNHRDKRNPLWEVNLLDLMIRHSTAAHKRETIAWCKRRQSSAEKLTILMVWRNMVKRRWEKGQPVSSGMLKGMSNRLLFASDILSQRIFRTRTKLPQTWSHYYDKAIETPALRVNRRHALSYAY